MTPRTLRTSLAGQWCLHIYAGNTEFASVLYCIAYASVLIAICTSINRVVIACKTKRVSYMLHFTVVQKKSLAKFTRLVVRSVTVRHVNRTASNIPINNGKFAV